MVENASSTLEGENNGRTSIGATGGSAGEEPRTFDLEGTASVSERVVEAVATAAAVDPLSMEPLYDSIDPDALDAVCSSGTGRGAGSNDVEVTFSYLGFRVTVHAPDRITVEEGSDRDTAVREDPERD